MIQVAEQKKNGPTLFVEIRCVACNKKLGELELFAGYKLLCERCKTLHVFNPGKLKLDFPVTNDSD